LLPCRANPEWSKPPIFRIVTHPRLHRLFSSLLIPFVACMSARADEAEPLTKNRMRVIVDNDFGGDPDGLFQLAHQLLSPSAEVRGIIGSHHYPEGFYGYPGTAAQAVKMAEELLEVMGMKGKIPVYAGAETKLANGDQAEESAASRFIIKEAMRQDTQSPLYILCGAGLTDLASACLIEPAITKRITVIWIGGPEHQGMADPPPGKQRVEYNLGIDLKAAQVVFHHADLRLWQVPRDAYRQVLVSQSELGERLKNSGTTGRYLMARLHDLIKRAKGSLGETYVLGDNPLVLLSALQTPWEADPASSESIWLPAPRIDDKGNYQIDPKGRRIRVFRKLDTRILLEDFFAKAAGK
jgi:purine nucleosidase